MSIARFLARRVDVWLPGGIGLVGLAYLLHVADRATPPNSFQIKIFVVILALSAASFAALIPGMLTMSLSTVGLTLRAAGALAVFVLVIVLPPAQGWLADSISPPVGGPTSVVASPASAPLASASAPALALQASPAASAGVASSAPPEIREANYTVAKKEWRAAGGDGQGGTLLFYDVAVPGRILSVGVIRCTGCGGWFWLCPDPRCGGRPLVEMIDASHARLWAATNSGDATSTTFSVKYQLDG